MKEPAISDGRIRPGDKLISANGNNEFSNAMMAHVKRFMSVFFAKEEAQTGSFSSLI